MIAGFSWPITRERYRQVLAKMHRHWHAIQELEARVRRLERHRDRLKATVSRLEGRPVERNKIVKHNDTSGGDGLGW